MGRRSDILRVGEARSMLVDGLPVRVELDGRLYPIRWDFRCGILLTELFSDDSLTEDNAGRVQLAVKLFSPALWEAVVRGEASLSASFEAVAAFYACGRGSDGGARGGTEPRVMDFSVDEERILAAFHQVYGIDLCGDTLHWWQFIALLRGLPEDCMFMRVVRLRGMDTSRIADEETRGRLRQAKAAVRIRKNGKDGMTK